MKRKIPTNTSRRPRLIGPATLLALLLGVAILIVGRMSNAPAQHAGVVFEADAQGHMQRIASASALPSPKPKLWKPEVNQLVEKSVALRLTPEQTANLNHIDARWMAEKVDLEGQLSRAVTQAKPQVKGSVEQMTANLGDYSRLSRRYEERRAAFWSQVLATLSEPQYQEWNRIAPQEGRVSQ